MAQNRDDSDGRWVHLRVKGDDQQLILTALCTSRGIDVGRPPRTRSVMALRCTREQSEELMQQMIRVLRCVELAKYEAMDQLLKACGASLSPDFRKLIGVLRGVVSKNEEFAQLYASIVRPACSASSSTGGRKGRVA